jgi:hypothetical protein
VQRFAEHRRRRDRGHGGHDQQQRRDRAGREGTEKVDEDQQRVDAQPHASQPTHSPNSTLTSTWPPVSSAAGATIAVPTADCTATATRGSATPTERFYALLVAGSDGLHAVAHGPLAAPIPSRLWLLLAPAHNALAPPLKAALWRATSRRSLLEAA